MPVDIASSVDFPAIPDLKEKTIVLTGGTHGLGRGSLLELAKHHPRTIILTGRNAQAAEEIEKEIKTVDNNVEVIFIRSDHSSLESTSTATKQIISRLDRLDILVLNAGVMGRDAQLTKDGHEWHFGINHLAHAQMIKLLTPLLNKTADACGDARVVVISSSFPWIPREGIVFETLNTSQDWWYGGRWMRYGQSKLANSAYATSVAEETPKISCISLHPGIVSTGLWGHALNLPNRLLTLVIDLIYAGPLDPTVSRICWAATCPKTDLEPGAYYEHPNRPGVHSPHTGDTKFRRRLWDWTQEQLKSHN